MKTGKIARIILCVLCAVIAAVCVLQATGIVNLQDGFNKAEVTQAVPTEKNGVTTVWKSDPFGELDTTLSFEYIKEKSGAEKLNIHLLSADKSVDSAYEYPVELLSPENYDNFAYGTLDRTENERYNFGFVPLTCEYVTINGIKLTPVEGEILIDGKETKFKVLISYDKKTTADIKSITAYDSVSGEQKVNAQ